MHSTCMVLTAIPKHLLACRHPSCLLQHGFLANTPHLPLPPSPDHDCKPEVTQMPNEQKPGREANRPRPPTATTPTHTPCTQQGKKLGLVFAQAEQSCINLCTTVVQLYVQSDFRQSLGKELPDFGCYKIKERVILPCACAKQRTADRLCKVPADAWQCEQSREERHVEVKGAGQGYSRERVAKPRSAASPSEHSLPLPSPAGQAFP